MDPVDTDYKAEFSSFLEEVGLSARAIDLDDEHDRLSVFDRVLRRRIGANEPLDDVAMLIAREPDRTMAESVIGRFLRPGVDASVKTSLGAAAGDSRFVRTRILELEALEMLSAADASWIDGDVPRTGWFEEALSETSSSRDVLAHLAEHAARRRARSTASRRLRELSP